MTLQTYYISLYFDKDTDNWLSDLISQAAQKCHDNVVKAIPPHITVAMLKAQDSDILGQKIDTIINEFFIQEILIAGIGLFQTKVVYLQPVLNWYLHNISVRINDTFAQEQQKDNKYIPYNWIPHISIAKRLTDTEQIDVIKLLQKEKFPRQAKICYIGLERAKPYKSIKMWALQDLKNAIKQQ